MRISNQKIKENIMKTLVIHPKDISTVFLSTIYENLTVTLINDPTTGEKEIIKAINEHDRIIMCGHGCGDGLFGHMPGGLIINKNMVPALRKKECIFIWCNADEFVKKNYLTGFYTGMFISEVGEARCFNIKISQEEVDYSNKIFATLVRNAFREITEYPDKMVDGRNVDNLFRVYEYVASSYKGNCPVINFNRNRLYFNILDSGMMLTFSNYDPADSDVRETEHEFKSWINYMEEEMKLKKSDSKFHSEIHDDYQDQYNYYDDKEMYENYDYEDYEYEDYNNADNAESDVIEAYYEWEASGSMESFDVWYSNMTKNEDSFDGEDSFYDDPNND
jgi:hypothetical protein